MDTIGRGIIAGFLATLALSVVVDPMAMLARMHEALPPLAVWFVHFLVGSLIWGAGFALLNPGLAGPPWLRGMQFGLGAWLIVMLGIMPFTAGGLFGAAFGYAMPIALLALHLVYGALLGGIFGALDPVPDEEAEEDGLHPLPR